MKNKFYKVEKEFCNIINSEVWIELKKHVFLFNFNQKIKGMHVYKVLHDGEVYVFAT